MKKQLGIFLSLGLLLAGIGYKWQMQGMQEKEKIDVTILSEQLKSINEEIVRKKQGLNTAADDAHEQQLQADINTLEKKAELLSNQILVFSQHIIQENIPSQNCLLSAQFVRSISHTLQHNSVVWSAAFSPDGSKVVTASWDNTARIWDAATGAPVGQPLQHNGVVFSAVFSPDGSKVVTTSGDNTARIWDASSGQQIGQPLQHNAWVSSAAFSSDGSRVVTASHDGTARIWDAASGKQVGKPLQHNDVVLSAAFSPDSSKVVTASQDHTARIWHIGFLNLMNKVQCELLQMFDLLMQDTGKAIKDKKPLPGRIQATREQWHTFKSLPPSIQNKLQKYITAPPKFKVSTQQRKESEAAE